MTTVVYKDGVMVSDGLVTGGGRVISENEQKVFNIRNHLVGFSGAVSSAKHFLDWLKTDLDSQLLSINNPNGTVGSPEPVKYEDFYAIVVSPDKSVTYFEGGNKPYTMSTIGDYYALGSGSDYALAALDAGATLDEALEVAKRRDVYSGGESFKVEFDKVEEVNENTLEGNNDQ